MLTAFQIINEALKIAKIPNFTGDGLNLLNAVLSDLSYSAGNPRSRGIFTFNFNPALPSPYGSGPYPLPLDYVRTASSDGTGRLGRSVFWTQNSIPFPLVPCDLSEFNIQVRQGGLQSYPWLFSTDFSQYRLAALTTVALTSGGLTGTVASPTGIVNGMAAAGEGIAPGTTVTIAGTTLTLSQPATATYAGASVFFGTPPSAYIYPAPLTASPVTVRFQRLMPPIVDETEFPWFPYEGYLIEELAGRLMEISDDSRVPEFVGTGQAPGRAERRLSRFMSMGGDMSNPAQG